MGILQLIVSVIQEKSGKDFIPVNIANDQNDSKGYL